MAYYLQQDNSAQGKNFIKLEEYLKLDQFGKVQVEYIWIGGSGSDIRSKTKTLPKKVESLKDIPAWNYDGKYIKNISK